MCILHQLIILPLSLQNVACVQTDCCHSISHGKEGRRFKPLPGSVVRPCRLSRPSPAQALPVVVARILVNRARQHLGVARARAADESARPPSLSIGLRRDDGVLRAGEGGDPAALEFG